MVIFINFKKKQMFSKWMPDSAGALNYDNPVLTKWRRHGWHAIIMTKGLSWQEVMHGYTLIYRKERLKLEKKIFG